MLEKSSETLIHPPASYPPDVEKLIQDAQNMSATSPIPSSVLPPWLDSKLIKTGQQFIAKHFFLIFFTHFISLLLLLSYVPVRLVLLKTGKSDTKDKALKRYLSTLLHVKKWYESDFSVENGNSCGVQDVLKVRRIHDGVSKRLSVSVDLNNNSVDKCCPEANGGGGLPAITQLDMIVTQYGFMGLLASFPEKFGISTKNKEDCEGLQGFIHLWAVIGYLLGIEDRFNLCLEDKYIVKDFILKELLLKDLSVNMDNKDILWDSLTSAMSTMVPCLSTNDAFRYILEYVLEGKWGKMDLKLFTFYETFCYYLKVVLFNHVFTTVSLARPIFNGLLRLSIYYTRFRLSFYSKLVVCGSK